MLDTSINNSSQAYTAAACSPASLVALRDRNNKTWIIQKELIAWVREESYLKEARTTLGSRVVLSNGKWFDVPLSIDELTAALGLTVPPQQVQE